MDPAKRDTYSFVYVSNAEAASFSGAQSYDLRVDRLGRSINPHPDRICVNCVKEGVDDYKKTSLWRHVKDETGKVIRKDASGNKIWLCNAHGLAQDRTLKKTKRLAEQAIKQRMNVEALIDAPPLSDKEAEIIQKKMNLNNFY